MSQYDDEAWIHCYRVTIRNDIYRYHQEKTGEAPYELAQQYFPDDLERQTDMCMWIGESIGRAMELGYEQGTVPTDLVQQIAEKYNMVKVMDLEVTSFVVVEILLC